MLSAHFSKEEMSCRHCGQLPEGGISQALLNGLEELRSRLGKPINVTNSYRCPEHNAAVGGAYNSQHVLGTAADIWVDGMNVWDLYLACRQIFDGIGIYYGDQFVHVDMRDGGNSTGVYLWDDQE